MMTVQNVQEGMPPEASALTLCVSTFQLLLLVLNRLHLGLMDICESLPLSPVCVQPREHWIDLCVESSKLLQRHTRHVRRE